MIVQFMNVGTNQACWTAEMKVLSRGTLLKQVKPHITSKIIQFDYDEDKNVGHIYTGLFGRKDGTFREVTNTTRL